LSHAPGDERGARRDLSAVQFGVGGGSVSGSAGGTGSENTGKQKQAGEQGEYWVVYRSASNIRIPSASKLAQRYAAVPRSRIHPFT
jgi:hypothetical protein